MATKQTVREGEPQQTKRINVKLRNYEIANKKSCEMETYKMGEKRLPATTLFDRDCSNI